MLDAFVAAGGRAIDTADSCSAWVPGNEGAESETLIGEWLAAWSRPDDVVIATKVFSLPTRSGLSPEIVRAALDDSPRRLQTDHVDPYFAHRDDPEVPQADVVGVFDELVQAGKVREVGASNFSAVDGGDGQGLDVGQRLGGQAAQVGGVPHRDLLRAGGEVLQVEPAEKARPAPRTITTLRSGRSSSQRKAVTISRSRIRDRAFSRSGWSNTSEAIGSPSFQSMRRVVSGGGSGV